MSSTPHSQIKDLHTYLVRRRRRRFSVIAIPPIQQTKQMCMELAKATLFAPPPSRTPAFEQTNEWKLINLFDRGKRQILCLHFDAKMVVMLFAKKRTTISLLHPQLVSRLSIRSFIFCCRLLVRVCCVSCHPGTQTARWMTRSDSIIFCRTDKRLCLVLHCRLPPSLPLYCCLDLMPNTPFGQFL